MSSVFHSRQVCQYSDHTYLQPLVLYCVFLLQIGNQLPEGVGQYLKRHVAADSGALFALEQVLSQAVHFFVFYILGETYCEKI